MVSDSPDSTAGRPWGFRLAGFLLLTLGLAPIANWIPGGHEYPGYGDALDRWLSGGGIALGVGVIAALTFHRYPALWREGLWGRVAGFWLRMGARADLLLAGFATLLTGLISRLIFSGKPLLIDEIIQVYQARIFAQGRLWLPAPEYPEFTSAMHLIDWGGKVYGQFPAGGPAVLALGTLAHAEWLVGPVCTGISVYLLARLLRRVEPRTGVALAALLLFIASPFMFLMGGSYMNHVPTLTALLGAALALSHAVGQAPAQGRPAGQEGGEEQSSILAGFLAGLGLGIAASIRPTDGAAFALPMAAWLLWRARRGGRNLAVLLASGLGVAIPLALLLWVNANQTGSALHFGYMEMWGKSQELGFHEAPWGPAHTPLRGLELINLYLLRLQVYLFESAGPGLLFAGLALLLVRRLTALDRCLLAGSALLLAGYFAYWHDGFYLGPRFVYPLIPWLVLWTARLPAVLEQRHLGPRIRQGALSSGLVALGLGAVVYLPARGLQYHNGMQSMRYDVQGLVREAGVHDAIILVRESWGSQLMSRLWALGVSRTRAEQIYRSMDACDLDGVLASTEKSGDVFSLDSVFEAHQRTGDQLRGLLPPAFDSTMRFRPGAVYGQRCQRRIAETIAGFSLLAPLLVAEDDNRYVLDLHAHDSLLLARYPEREVWLLTQARDSTAAFRLERLNLDSAWAEWRERQ